MKEPKLTRGLLAILAFLAMAAPIASDIYLSSFPEIASDLSASASQVQLTLTFFLIGFGVGQLILGATSDRYGRRRVLLIALAIFAIAGVATVIAPNIWVLSLFRLVQGLSGAGAVVIARAIAADLTEGRETVRALSLIASFVGFGPILGPLLGALVGDFSGWRGALALVPILAALMLIFTIARVPESLPVRSRQTGGIGETFRNFGRLTSDSRFVMLLVAFSTSFATMLAYIAASPFVGQVVIGMTPFQFAIGFGVGATAIVAANLLNAQLARHVDPAHALLTGALISVIASALILTLTVTGSLTPVPFITIIFFLIFGIGLVMSNSSALAFLRATFARGSASALLGASQFLLAAAITPLVGAWGEHTALPFAITIVIGSCVSLAVAVVYLIRRRP